MSKIFVSIIALALLVSCGTSPTDLTDESDSSPERTIKEGSKYIYVNTGIGNLAYAGRVGIMPEISVLQIS